MVATEDESIFGLLTDREVGSGMQLEIVQGIEQKRARVIEVEGIGAGYYIIAVIFE